MNGVLLIFILGISSSYIENKELSATNEYDVIEFWITDDFTYRIKTFALDCDIQVAQMKTRSIEEMLDLAIATTKKNYGDVILKEIKIIIKNMKDDEYLKMLLAEHNLQGRFENGKILFWNPDSREYVSKSKP